jgi:hypothetical protein
VKRLIAIFFFTIYTATAFGVVVKFHFCDRTLTQITLSSLSGNCDRNSHSLIPMDCCKDKTICLKVNSSVITQQPFTLKLTFHQADLVLLSNPIHIFLITNTYISALPFNGPQRIPPKRIYLLDRVFRI